MKTSSFLKAKKDKFKREFNIKVNYVLREIKLNLTSQLQKIKI